MVCYDLSPRGVLELIHASLRESEQMSRNDQAVSLSRCPAVSLCSPTFTRGPVLVYVILLGESLEMEKPQSDSDERLQFSLLQMLGFVTFVGLLAGVLTIAYQAKKKTLQLRTEVAMQRLQIEELQVELRNAIGDGLRTNYAEKLLFHAVANFAKYPELENAMANYDKRKVGISVHGLGDDDNLTYLNCYTMEGNEASKPFCHSFLVQEKPFRILDSIVGEQSRVPKLQDGKWICGAGKNGRDRWFTIEDQKFNLVNEVTSPSE